MATATQISFALLTECKITLTSSKSQMCFLGETIGQVGTLTGTASGKLTTTTSSTVHFGYHIFVPVGLFPSCYGKMWNAI